MYPHIHVFGLEIPTFGVMMLLGMIAAFVLLYFNRKRVPFSEDDLITMALYAIIGGFIGAKVLYWIVEIDQIIADPHFLIETLTAGFVFYGALIVGAFAIWLFTRRRKQPLLGYLDLVSPSFILAQGFGRIGCFCAGCCYGAQCDSPLSVVYPAGTTAPAGVPVLPTQLFESAFCFVFAAVLTAIFRRQKRYGTTTGWYFIGYGVWRFIIEFFRSDDRGTIGVLSTSQFIGIFIVLAGIAILLLVKNGRTPAHIPPAKDAVETEDAVDAAGVAEESAEGTDPTEDAPETDAEPPVDAARATEESAGETDPAEDAPDSDAEPPVDAAEAAEESAGETDSAENAPETDADPPVDAAEAAEETPGETDPAEDAPVTDAESPVDAAEATEESAGETDPAEGTPDADAEPPVDAAEAAEVSPEATDPAEDAPDADVNKPAGDSLQPDANA